MRNAEDAAAVDEAKAVPPVELLLKEGDGGDEPKTASTDAVALDQAEVAPAEETTVPPTEEALKEVQANCQHPVTCSAKMPFVAGRRARAARNDWRRFGKIAELHSLAWQMLKMRKSRLK